MEQDFIDQYKNIHQRGEKLGQGGQGIVFRTKDPDLAVKLVTKESGVPVTDMESLKKYSERFKNVLRLPLPKNLNVCTPKVLLQDQAGYVMQLLNEMIPFNHFINGHGHQEKKITSHDIPKWLSEAPEEEAKKIIHYSKTGGIRRRLMGLYHCAAVLARLHGCGMVYGDISPSNIFISENLDHLSVWLIDADNIWFEIEKGKSVYTPKYGAPELVQGKDGGRPSSDCYAFAVVAFYILSLIHPFCGKKLTETDDNSDWADDENSNDNIEEQAYAGLLSWVDDQEDDSNSSESGFRRSLILTEKLTILFDNTFNETGRISPLSRPTIYHWPSALAQAADMTIQCPSCNMYYYYDFIHPETSEHHCPYCKEKRPRIFILKTYRWYGKEKPLRTPCWLYAREVVDDPHFSVILPKRVFYEFTMRDSDDDYISLSIEDKGVIVKKIDNESNKDNLLIATGDDQQSSFQKIVSSMRLSSGCFWLFVHSKNPRLVHCSIQ